MKQMSVLLAFLALLFCDLVLAGAAVVTSAIGPVQIQTGSAPARVLRQGDELNQGDTVITGANASVVLKFDDGQVAALTQNSRMQVTAYQYNPATESGNSLLSLVTGGMRAITGLIGKRTPERVTYRAATATIGIRGSDGNFAGVGGEGIVSSNEGVHIVTIGNQRIEILAGQAIHFKADGTFNRGTTAQVLRSASSTPAGQQTTNAFNGLQALNPLVNQSSPGTPRQGGDQQGQQNQNQQQPGQQGGQQGGSGSGGSGGGGGGGGATGS